MFRHMGRRSTSLLFMNCGQERCASCSPPRAKALLGQLRQFGGIPPLEKSITHPDHFKTVLEVLADGPPAYGTHPENNSPTYATECDDEETAVMMCYSCNLAMHEECANRRDENRSVSD